MRIATFNVNGLRARLDFVRYWLQAREPDLVGIQELKLTDELFPHDELAEVGYHAAVYGQKAWNGVAVLAREEPEVLERGLEDQEELGARWLKVRVAGLLFATVYCPNGKHVGHPDFQRKLEFFDALLDHLRSRHSEDEPLVLCGDFNIVPGPADSWNEDGLAGTIFHTEDERRRLGALLGWGLHDLFRELHPDAREFSWWDYRGGAFHRGHGLRIDLVLATRPVLDRAREAVIDRDYRKKKGDLTPSDHAPVILELE
jgi:exodeoxyribonuclease-3